ncbi:MAG: aminoglycoside phosphotransferase family protein [Candidatus Nealsonbacteria bacterium]|nr:aminoglycoside phosphotransferase family protein [Candidatus Nealsonbacteria bacterium]
MTRIAEQQEPPTLTQPPDQASDGELVARRWATSDVRRTEQDGQIVYVKEYHQLEDRGVTAEVIRRRTGREIDLFRRLASHFASERRLGSLNLVCGEAESGTLVTVEAPGRPLAEAILGKFRTSVDAQCLRALYLVGKWLRRFQSLPVNPGDEAHLTEDDPADLVEYCDIRMRRVLELGYGWPPDAIRREIGQCLAVLVKRSPEQDRRFVWSHGDYGAQNILWDGNVLTPIDFNTAKLSYPLHDVTYFIHRLEMFRVYFPWRRWPLAAWRRAVLRGYGRPDAEQSPMYRAMMIRHLHCRLNTYVRRPTLNLKQRVHNAWTRQRVRAKLLRLAAKD